MPDMNVYRSIATNVAIVSPNRLNQRIATKRAVRMSDQVAQQPKLGRGELGFFGVDKHPMANAVELDACHEPK